ncbi:MAG: efflux RND transporter periplasmic adaptor subunit [Cyanobacteria bacterium P01_D01_bin.128]
MAFHHLRVLRRHPQRWATGFLVLRGAALIGCLTLSAGCELFPKGQAQPSPQSDRRESGPVSVETVVAAPGTLNAALTYTGTTAPLQQVTLKAQASGQVRQLTVDVGDRVSSGQLVAQIDDQLLTVDVQAAQAELASRRSEVAQTQAQVSDAQTAVEQTRVNRQQAQADAERLRRLANQGAVSEQEAEQAESALAVAQQALASAQQQVRTQQAAVEAARGQVSSQQAVLGRSQEQFTYTRVVAPLAGRVLTRLIEVGDVVQIGDEIAQVGDFSAAKIEIQVSELDLQAVQLGQPVEVRLDAFPDQNFTGRVSRISPVADPTARLIPVEITVPNDAGRIGSGLLARVTLSAEDRAIILPDSVLGLNPAEQSLIYVIEQRGEQAVVDARQVELGNQQNGQVEVLAGLTAGESVVVRSGGPLEAGQRVNLSILSDE